MTNGKADFTQGSILKKLVFFMMPVLGALILQAAYGAVDLLVVGRFGSTSGLSAVSTGSQVLNLVTFVVITVCYGHYRFDCPVSGRKKAGRNRSSHQRSSGGIYYYFCSAVSGHGMFGTAHFRSDAGTGRGC